MAVRRAGEYATAAADTSLTLVNVQPPGDGDDAMESPVERGQAVIEDLVERAGIEYFDLESRVIVADDTERAILDAAEAYDTICVGAMRSGALSQALFGSIPENVGREADGTVVMARGAEEAPMSIREAIRRRLEV